MFCNLNEDNFCTCLQELPPPVLTFQQYSDFIRHLDASKYHVDLLNSWQRLTL